MASGILPVAGQTKPKPKPPGDGKEMLLVDMEPKEIEFGMLEIAKETWGLASGPNVIDMGSWGGLQSMPWSDARKIVKSIPKNFTIPAGSTYNCFTPDVFAVEGDFKTGVGLLAMSNAMYHWIEYEIPKGAKKFEAELFVTDDVAGARSFVRGGHVVNQSVIVKVSVDGKEVVNKPHYRMGITMGSGMLIDTVIIDLPVNAKVLRIHFESTTAPDNINNELLISGGKFIF
ncbi:MAG: hypothetical protein SFY92_07010 [Verrucomicrobiae bacterium]|nr:hypothetical protein [Verrucomicrobiae bacterium]